MSNRTIIISLPDEKVANYLFKEHFINTCESAGVMVRCEPYDLDIYNELNLRALEIEKSRALNELEDEILNNVACVGGSCED